MDESRHRPTGGAIHTDQTMKSARQTADWFLTHGQQSGRSTVGMSDSLQSQSSPAIKCARGRPPDSFRAITAGL